MAGFCDGGTKATGGTKIFNLAPIMEERMLPWKSKALMPDTYDPKRFAKSHEFVHETVQVIQR